MKSNKKYKKINIGIGCFHFGIKKKPVFIFKKELYFKELREALQKIPGVTRIIFDNLDLEELSNIKVREALKEINKGDGFFPPLSFLQINFQVRIPKILQKEILKPYISKLKTFDEVFKISIRYNYFLPVAFIESKGNDPSIAVILIREYLRSHLSNAKNLRFECLGPSPFHARFYILPKKRLEKQNEKGIEIKIVDQLGYDLIVFHYDNSYFKNDIKYLKDYILDEIDDELGFFYQIKSDEVYKMYKWREIEKHLNVLISLVRTNGLLGYLKQFFGMPKKIDDIFIAFAKFETEAVIQENSYNDSYGDIYKSEKMGYLRKIIDKSLNSRSKYPIQQVYKLIELFEARKTQKIENVIVIISAIVGGLIGSVLAILFKVS